jgi:hypothetical protein
MIAAGYGDAAATGIGRTGRSDVGEFTDGKRTNLRFAICNLQLEER